MRCRACTWPPALHSVSTRPATLAFMSISWLPSGSCGSVLMAGVKVSLLRPLAKHPSSIQDKHHCPTSLEETVCGGLMMYWLHLMFVLLRSTCRGLMSF